MPRTGVPGHLSFIYLLFIGRTREQLRNPNRVYTKLTSTWSAASPAPFPNFQ
jgi:hypothetical protein